jgi:hypothetical protein
MGRFRKGLRLLLPDPLGHKACDPLSAVLGLAIALESKGRALHSASTRN